MKGKLYFPSKWSMLLMCTEDSISMIKCRQPLSGEKFVLRQRRLHSLPSFLICVLKTVPAQNRNCCKAPFYFFHRDTTVIFKGM